MIDEEVETVLREIRERVISQPHSATVLIRLGFPGANGNQNSQLVAIFSNPAPEAQRLWLGSTPI